MNNRTSTSRSCARSSRNSPAIIGWTGLATLGVPCSPINRVDQVFDDPQVKARGVEIEMPHPCAPKPIHLIGSPMKFSETPVDYRYAPPTLDSHRRGAEGVAWPEGGYHRKVAQRWYRLNQITAPYSTRGRRLPTGRHRCPHTAHEPPQGAR